MDWNSEALALMEDMGPFVAKIEIAREFESSDMQIFFNIETLEGNKLVVRMAGCGFSICRFEQSQTKRQDSEFEEDKVYETINALLDDNSPKYRDAFARSLIDKMRLITEN